MKLKTAAVLMLIPIAVFLPYFFLTNADNQAVFAQELRFFGLSFTVQTAFLVLAATAALIPSLYFSRVFARLRHYAKQLEGEAKLYREANRRFDRATALLAHGDGEAALIELEGDASPRAVPLRARALRISGRIEEARTLLEPLFEETAEAAAGYLLVTVLEELGRSPVNVLERLIANQPKDAEQAYRKLLSLRDRQQQWQECLALAERMKAADIELEPLTLLGYRFELGRSHSEWTAKKTIEHFQQILKEAPQFIPANLALGDAYLAAGSLEKAFRVFEQAFTQTRSPVFLDRLERFYLDRDQPQEAIRVYRQLSVKADGPLVRFRLGKLYLYLEMPDEALESLAPLRGSLGHLPTYLHLLAEAEARRDLTEEAIGDFREMARAVARGDDFYHCGGCKATHNAWQARCKQCRRWGSLMPDEAFTTAQEAPTSPLYY